MAVNKPMFVTQAVAGAVATLLLATTPTDADAAVLQFDWTGSFTMLNRFGDTLMNSSINAKQANQYQTPISGTLTLDTDAGNGSMTIAPFDWQNQPAELPAYFHDIQFELIGDGAGGAGSLVLGNMLYDWNGNTNISVSMVWDMLGLLDAVAGGVSLGSQIGGVGVAPASDGTLSPHNGGTYLMQGPVPVATTDYDTTSVAGCEVLNCINVLPSGVLPLVEDTVFNQFKSTDEYSYYGIGGSPVMDGPWSLKSFNIDIAQLTVTDIVSEVPVLPSVWLFGTGLAGVLFCGVRRKAGAG